MTKSPNGRQMSERWAGNAQQDIFSPTFDAETLCSDLATCFRDLENIFTMESLASAVFANYS